MVGELVSLPSMVIASVHAQRSGYEVTHHCTWVSTKSGILPGGRLSSRSMMASTAKLPSENKAPPRDYKNHMGYMPGVPEKVAQGTAEHRMHINSSLRSRCAFYVYIHLEWAGSRLQNVRGTSCQCLVLGSCAHHN